jgi:hypothetical protein
MATWMRITTKKDGWPAKTRILILLREDSYNGTPLSGDVTIVIRRDNNPSTTTKLGLSDTDLVVHVSNGRWESPEWDYAYWAGKGFNTLVALYQGQEWFWSSIALSKKESKPEPTSINKIHYTCVVDRADASNMDYALTWTILDQKGKPIAGQVTVIFDGATETRDSEPGRPGVCFDKVVVSGYETEMFYTVLPPTGEPQMIKLVGPKKTAPKNVADNLVSSHSGFPNSDGFFQVSIATRKGNDPVQGKFLIQASSDTTAAELDGTVIGVGRQFSLETDVDGNHIVLLNPKDRRTDFVFTNLANGKKYIEQFVKPPVKV